MKPEEINKAIAESLGWTRADESYPYQGTTCKCIVWRNEKGTPLPLGDDAIPSFVESLDACAEFERCNQNTYEDLEAYENILWRICRDQNIGKDNPLPPAIAHVIATAAQRC